MKLIAVDPGNTCGMASVVLEDKKVATFESWEEKPYAAARYVEVASIDPISVAYETFTPRPGAYTWQPEALYTIGTIRYLGKKYGFETVGQSPADAKRFSTNDKLKKIGWRNPSTGGHADDAARHLLLLAVRIHALDTEVLL